VQGIAISREIGEPLDVRLRDRFREGRALSEPRDHTPAFASRAAGPSFLPGRIHQALAEAGNLI